MHVKRASPNVEQVSSLENKLEYHPVVYGKVLS